ncbi:MAG: hypothetical protein ACLUD2_21385 [Clostridium sp.]
MTEAENMPVEDKALRYVAKAGDGSMRDALSLLDQCAAFHFGETLTYEHVLDVLGAVDNSVFRDLFHAIRENRTKDCILKLEEMVVQGRELSQFVVDFIWFLRNLLLLRTADDAEDLLDMSEDNLTQLREDAALVDENTLMRYIRVFSELSNQIRFANQKRVLIELAFIKLTKPEMEQSMDSVLERLEKLERMVEEMSAGRLCSGTDCRNGRRSHDKCRAADPAAGIRAAGLTAALVRRETAWSPQGSLHRIRQICRTSKVRSRIMSRGPYPCRKPSWKIST